MRYLSLFSGIEAASVAWHPLGWQPVAFAEIEPFPSAVLQHRFPSVPNWGDVSKFKEWPDESIDLIVGGSPCQAFSVAGLRKGLDDPRGNLSLTYLAIVEKYLPEWIVWENVPGVLSSSGGRDFASFLGALDALGYGYAWRVLDAQYVRTPDYPRAVPQRRRRVFVVGNRRGWQRAAAVLFDSESVCGNPPPSREKRQGFTSASSEGVGGEGGIGVASALQARYYKGANADGLSADSAQIIPVDSPIVLDRAAYSQGENARYPPYIEETDLMPALVSRGPHAIAHAFKIRGGSETETGEQGGTPGRKAGKGYLGSDDTAFTVASTQDQHLAVAQQNVAGTLDANYYKGCGSRQGGEREIVAVAYETNPTDARVSEIKDGVAPTVKARWGTGGNNQALVQQAMAFDGYNQTVSETAQTIRSDKTDGDHVGMVLQQVQAFDTLNHSVSDVAQTVKSPSGGANESVGTVHQSSMAFEPESIARNAGPSDLSEVSPTLRRQMGDNQPATLSAMAVRRLTPVECERLQGFPDGWTQIPWRKKPAEDCPDGPRYKAIGNSMAVNVMQWIGLRIAMFEELKEVELVPNYTDTYRVK